MALNHMKLFPALLVIRKMQIKTTKWYLAVSSDWQKLILITLRFGKDEMQWALFLYKLLQPLWKAI